MSKNQKRYKLTGGVANGRFPYHAIRAIVNFHIRSL